MKLDHSMIRCDQHMHTEFSTDSEASVRSMLDESVERGLQSVCITDHLDLDYPRMKSWDRIRSNSIWENILKR